MAQKSPLALAMRPISDVRRPRFRPSASKLAASGCSRPPSGSSQSSLAPDRWCEPVCRPSAQWHRTRAQPGRVSWRCACDAAAGTRTAAVALLRRGHQRGIHHLTAARDKTPLEQLHLDAVENGFRSGFPDPVLEDPYRGSVRDVDRICESAETRVTHAVEQRVFHRLVGQVVPAFQDQDAHHRRGRLWRTPALSTLRRRRDAVNLGCPRRKIDVRFDLGQRIAQRIEL